MARTTRKAAGKTKKAKPAAKRTAPSARRSSAAPRRAPTKKASPGGKTTTRRAKPAARRPKPAAKAPRAPAKSAIVSFKERPAPSQVLAEARPLRIALFGASGMVGQRIAKEALARGHSITAVMRHPERLTLTHPKMRPVKADATDPLMAATVARGHDAIVSAIAPDDDSPETLADAAKSILQAAREAGVKRVVVVNGAGSLKVNRSRMLMDTPQFPADWRPIAKAHKDALEVLRTQGGDLDWTAVSPAALFEPGTRTGKYRTGGDELVVDAKGRSRISVEDYAVALLDELEREQRLRQRMTVAY